MDFSVLTLFSFEQRQFSQGTVDFTGALFVCTQCKMECIMGTVVEGRVNFSLVEEKQFYLVFLFLTCIYMKILMKF